MYNLIKNILELSALIALWSVIIAYPIQLLRARIFRPITVPTAWSAWGQRMRIDAHVD